MEILGYAIAVVLQMAVGGLWYSPVMFGHAWVAAQGRDMNDIEGESIHTPMALSAMSFFVAAFVMRAVLANVETLSGALIVATWLWVGFVAAMHVRIGAWEKRSWRLVGINISETLVSMWICAAVVHWWF